MATRAKAQKGQKNATKASAHAGVEEQGESSMMGARSGTVGGMEILSDSNETLDATDKDETSDASDNDEMTDATADNAHAGVKRYGESSIMGTRRRAVGGRYIVHSDDPFSTPRKTDPVLPPPMYRFLRPSVKTIAPNERRMESDGTLDATENEEDFPMNLVPLAGTPTQPNVPTTLPWESRRSLTPSPTLTEMIDSFNAELRAIDAANAPSLPISPSPPDQNFTIFSDVENPNQNMPDDEQLWQDMIVWPESPDSEKPSKDEEKPSEDEAK